MLDREWARGMNQEQFNVAFERRFPGADVIPDVELWVNSSEPEYHGISPVLDDDFITEVVGAKAVPEEGPQKLEPRIKQPGKFVCDGCGEKFDYHIVRWRHMKKCQKILAEVK